MSKKPRRSPQQKQQPQHFELAKIHPMTPNQEEVFSSYRQGYNLMLTGYAGTGKTFCALYLALEEILKTDSDYDKIVIVRSVVPSRDMGFLPGSMKEKIAVYEEPYREICNDLFGRGDGYEVLKTAKNLIQFTTTSFLRGTTFKNAIVIVDECQSMTWHELSTVITRLGDTSKVVFIGDLKQNDLLKSDRDVSGFKQFVRVIDNMTMFDLIEFGPDDIVRGPLVKQFILESGKLGL